MKKHLFPQYALLAILLSGTLVCRAQNPTALVIPPTPDEYLPVAMPAMSAVTTIPTPEAAASRPIEMSAEELLANPAILQAAMDSVLQNHNPDGAAVLIPIYRQWPQHDKLLLQYAQAMVAQHQGRLGEAIALYRQLLAELPDNTVIRFYLATALFHSQQNEAAADQFEKLRSANLPPNVLQTIESFQAALRQRNDWSFSGSISYVADKNINNTPAQKEHSIPCPDGSTGCLITLPPNQAAHGLSYAFSANKTVSLADRFIGTARLNANGVFYWDRHSHDDAAVRIYAGGGYRNQHSQWQLLPYFEKRFFGGEAYSHTVGVRAEAQQLFAPNWQLFAAADYGRQQFARRRFLDGQSYLLSATLMYAPSVRQYWLLGYDISGNNTQDRSETFLRQGVRLGWGQEWVKGISSSMDLGLAKRHYAEPTFLSPVPRQDTEYTVSLSLWHRAVHLYGITPRLTWEYRRNASNHFLYRYHKNQLSLSFSKKF